MSNRDRNSFSAFSQLRLAKSLIFASPTPQFWGEKARNFYQHLIIVTLGSFFVSWEPVFAQVSADDTLGAERSIVTPNVVIKGVPSDRIDGGARRGANLFHSFGQFIIPEGRGAYFSNPDGIRTIFSRVTGGNGSQILGTLGVLGNANLFLIDPKGIIFGANAKLDISGSFIGSTANGIVFPNGENFSASNPNAAPLLTIDVPVPVGLVFESDNSGIILNAADLKNQQNLALIAGGILSSGRLSTPGGNITLATVPGAVDSIVGLDGTGKFLGTIQGIGQPNLTSRDIVLIGGAIDASSNGIAGNVILNSAGNTSLSNGATVDVRGAGGGSITVNAQNLGMSKGSQLQAGIKQGLGALGAQARNVTLNVADEIAISQSSGIENRVNENAIGNGGDIVINTGSLSLLNDAQLTTSTAALGNAGKIRVNASEAVNLSSRASFETSTAGLQSGNAGDIFIKARSLSVTDRATLNASTASILGLGEGGDIVLRIEEKATFDNANTGSVVLLGAGKGGSIDIQARSLSLSNDALFATVTTGQGNAGNILIKASESIAFNSGSTLRTDTISSGNAGNISIEAEKATVFFDGAKTGASTSVSKENIGEIPFVGTGQGGNISIKARALSVTNGARLLTSTNGERGERDLPNAGNINVNVSEAVSLDGGAQLRSDTTGVGNAGRIEIAARSLFATDNAQISASTTGQGNGGDIALRIDETARFDNNVRIGSVLASQATGEGGNINIQARSLSLSNGASILTTTLGAGKAGNLTINTKQLLVRDGALILTATQGAGDGGVLTVNATESVQLIGTAAITLGRLFSGLLTNAVGTESTGNAGDLIINTGKLLIRDGAVVSTGTQGAGDGGNLTVNATESVQLIGTGNVAIGQNIFRFPSSLRTETLENSTGDAGNLLVNTGQLLVKDGASIVTTAEQGSRGNAGNLTVKASELVQLSGTSTDGQSISRLNSSTLGQGNAGDLSITTKRLLVQNGAGIIAGSQGQGDAGDIEIKTGQLLVQDRAVISTTTFGEGKGGNLNINASDSVYLDRGFVISGVIENGQNDGGNIDIRARSLSVTNGSFLLANTEGKGNAGNINIDVDKTVTVSGVITRRLTGNDFVFPSIIASSVDAGGEGQGGNINIQAESLSLNNVGVLSSGTSGQGNAGSISLEIDDFVTFNNLSGIQSNVERNGVGIGGNVDIQARSLTLKDGSTIQAALRAANDESPGGVGKGGNIHINTSDFVEISGTSPRPISIFFTVNPNNPGEPLQIEPPGFSSGLFTSTQTGASGQAGNIFITTGEFRLADGAVVEAQTANFGRAGDITINANTVDITGGAQVISATRGSGDAGDIMLKVKDSLTLSGSDPNFERRLAGVGGDRDRITNLGPESGLFANTDVDSTGDGGNIFIENYPNAVTIDDGAVVTVNSQGRGEGGQIQLEAGSLTLDNGTLSAQIDSNQTGESVGNITLDVQNLLLLRNGSQISTTVGTPGAGGNGGNIFINAGAIVAVPDENSDITANAFEGTGGNISISTESIFGIDFRERLTPLSDITASSNAGFTGRVEINTSGIDPTRGLENLPQNNINVEVAQGCQVGGNGENNISFYNLGRGGVPPSPDDLLNSPFRGEWLMLSQESNNVESEVDRNDLDWKQRRDRFFLRISCGK